MDTMLIVLLLINAVISGAAFFHGLWAIQLNYRGGWPPPIAETVVFGIFTVGPIWAIIKILSI